TLPIFSIIASPARGGSYPCWRASRQQREFYNNSSVGPAATVRAQDHDRNTNSTKRALLCRRLRAAPTLNLVAVDRHFSSQAPLVTSGTCSAAAAGGLQAVLERRRRAAVHRLTSSPGMSCCS